MALTASTQPSSPACPACDSTATRSRFVKDGIPYYDCPACTFRFSRPASNANFQSSMDGFEDAYVQYLGADAADRKNFQRTCKYIERFSPLAGASLLDVGCGSGKWVRFLREEGIDAAGLEPCGALYDQYLASEGYTVLSVNYRGGSGRWRCPRRRQCSGRSSGRSSAPRSAG